MTAIYILTHYRADLIQDWIRPSRPRATCTVSIDQWLSSGSNGWVSCKHAVRTYQNCHSLMNLHSSVSSFPFLESNRCLTTDALKQPRRIARIQIISPVFDDTVWKLHSRSKASCRYDQPLDYRTVSLFFLS